ncbi:hypothetical protein [Spirillospora sp. CA-294931]|uniref:hypothetical protein n=1 Tax=Spirillospora sp. CA-294931 TaxID=3240042 RepID=UPI003D93EC1B
MYLATSPRPAGAPAPAGRAPLRLSRVVSRTFATGRPFLPDPVEPGLARMQADLARPYSLDFVAELFEHGVRNTFTEMTEELLAELLPMDPPDLVLVANTVPDADPRRSPSCYLAEAVPGDPLSFNLSDQGVAAGFTALRLVAEYGRADAFGRALVVLLDQRTFLYDTTGADHVPLHDSVVGLVFGPEGDAGEPVTRQLTEVAPEAVGEALAALLAGPPATVIAGPGIDPGALGPGHDVRPVPEGRPCTGPWSALGDALPGLREDGARRVAVADYDSTLRYLCVSTMDLEEGA